MAGWEEKLPERTVPCERARVRACERTSLRVCQRTTLPACERAGLLARASLIASTNMLPHALLLCMFLLVLLVPMVFQSTPGYFMVTQLLQ